MSGLRSSPALLSAHGTHTGPSFGQAGLWSRQRGGRGPNTPSGGPGRRELPEGRPRAGMPLPPQLLPPRSGLALSSGPSTSARLSPGLPALCSFRPPLCSTCAPACLRLLLLLLLLCSASPTAAAAAAVLITTASWELSALIGWRGKEKRSAPPPGRGAHSAPQGP